MRERDAVELLLRHIYCFQKHVEARGPQALVLPDERKPFLARHAAVADIYRGQVRHAGHAALNPLEVILHALERVLNFFVPVAVKRNPLHRRALPTELIAYKFGLLARIPRDIVAEANGFAAYGFKVGGLRIGVGCQVAHGNCAVQKADHVLGVDAEVVNRIKPFFVDLFFLFVAVVADILRRRLAPHKDGDFHRQGNLHRVRVDAAVRVPHDVAFADERLAHEFFNRLPIGFKFQVIDAELLDRALVVAQRVGPVKTVVKTHNKRLNIKLAHERVGLKGAVLAAAKRYDAVVLPLAAVLVKNFMQLRLALGPVYLLLLKLHRPAGSANALSVKADHVLRLEHYAFSASTHSFSFLFYLAAFRLGRTPRWGTPPNPACAPSPQNQAFGRRGGPRCFAQ